MHPKYTVLLKDWQLHSAPYKSKTSWLFLYFMTKCYFLQTEILQILSHTHKKACSPDFYLWKFALFIHKGDNIHGFYTNQVKSILVVDKLDMLPTDAFIVILLLLQFEDVLYKELLQVLIGIVNTQLFKTEMDQKTLLLIWALI